MKEKFYNTLKLYLKDSNDEKHQIILVVDDLKMNRAVAKAHKGISAVLMDIQMPNMDGTELIQRIRSNDEYRHIAIIANTAFADPEQEEKLLAMGSQ